VPICGGLLTGGGRCGSAAPRLIQAPGPPVGCRLAYPGSVGRQIGRAVGPWVGVNTGPHRRKPHPPTNRRPERPGGSRAVDPHRTSGSGADPLGLHQLAAAGVIDVIPGDPPVPISVWRVAGTGGAGPHGLIAGLDPQAAALLVGLYTQPGDTLVDLTADPAVAGAAGAGARRYLPANHPADLVLLEHVAGTARLVLLRWPSPAAPGNPGEETSDARLAELLGGCRRLLAAGGCVIVALAPPPRTGYVDHARRLIPAARRAGLGYLQHIVVLTAPIPGDPSPRQATPAGPATLRAATHLQVQANLLAFVLRGGRHG
jgi:hypothetical protein